MLYIRQNMTKAYGGIQQAASSKFALLPYSHVSLPTGTDKGIRRLLLL